MSIKVISVVHQDAGREPDLTHRNANQTCTENMCYVNKFFVLCVRSDEWMKLVRIREALSRGGHHVSLTCLRFDLCAYPHIRFPKSLHQAQSRLPSEFFSK
jgi:hypothetical protein